MPPETFLWAVPRFSPWVRKAKPGFPHRRCTQEVGQGSREVGEERRVFPSLALGGGVQVAGALEAEPGRSSRVGAQRCRRRGGRTLSRQEESARAWPPYITCTALGTEMDARGREGVRAGWPQQAGCGGSGPGTTGGRVAWTRVRAAALSGSPDRLTHRAGGQPVKSRCLGSKFRV